MATIDGVHEIVLNLFRHQCSRFVNILAEELHVALDGLELILDSQTLLLYHLFQCLYICLWQCEYHFGMRRNGIAHVAAFPADQTGTQLGDGLTHETHHLLIGVGTACVDLQTRVSATQALQRHLDGSLLVVLYFLILHCSGDVNATSTSDAEVSPCLRVEVEIVVSVELTLGQLISSEHTCLLVACNQSLQRSVLKVVALEHTHDGSHAHTVVRTERSALSVHPSVLDVGLNRISLEIMIAVGSLLWHHIHVSLQQRGLTVLIARGGRFAHDDIASSVLESLHANLCCEVEKELLYFL